jgi:hypothetical protein
MAVSEYARSLVRQAEPSIWFKIRISHRPTVAPPGRLT